MSRWLCLAACVLLTVAWMPAGGEEAPAAPSGGAYAPPASPPGEAKVEPGQVTPELQRILETFKGVRRPTVGIYGPGYLYGPQAPGTSYYGPTAQGGYPVVMPPFPYYAPAYPSLQMWYYYPYLPYYWPATPLPVLPIPRERIIVLPPSPVVVSPFGGWPAWPWGQSNIIVVR